MSKRTFTKEQIKELLFNPNVLKCSEKSITYKNSFKTAALKEWKAGLLPQEIFLQAGFNIDLIGRKVPKQCLERWRETFRDKGIQGFSETRGKARGRKKANWKNDKEKIKYLETKIAYLKAENDFLAKLRKES